jgi:putative ABC transport system permease protein
MGQERKGEKEIIFLLPKMKLKKSLHLALNILFHSKLRSWLTIIGIIIGIGAVVGIISMSLGAQQQLEERLSQFGANIITITSGSSRAMGIKFGGEEPFGGKYSESASTAKNLTSKDIILIRSISNIKYVMGEVSGKADISYSSKTASKVSCTGVDVLVWKDITTEQLSSGRLLMAGDSYSVVVGETLAKSMFGTQLSVNDKITIGGASFNVVGILESGNSVYMPLETARNVLDDVRKNSFDSISVMVYDVSLSNDTVNDITKKLMILHGILQENKKDFTVTNPITMQKTMESTMSTMTLFLGAIAAISLLVGAIGIANTMFTSVLEKTNEIGIMKAIGARNKDILSIFLFNSGLIGLVGGIGGVIVGVLASTIINTMAGISVSSSRGPTGGAFGFLGGSSYVSIQLILGALFFAIIIGMIAGAIPARRASKLNPVDALRYE